MFDVTRSGHVAHLRLGRPEASNALNVAFWSGFGDAVRALDRAGETRALVISGQGRNFCAGMDISVFAGGGTLGVTTPAEREGFIHAARALQDTFTVLERVRFPVIAAIQGACVGAGLEMAAACDLRFAAADAYFRIEEINIGMMADVGSLQRLPKLLPDAVVREMALLGATLDAARALALGFVNGVSPAADETLEAAMAAAARAATKAPLAIAGSKAALRYARDHSVADGLDWAAMMNAAIWSTDDITGAIRARAEKQAPQFPPLLALRSLGD